MYRRLKPEFGASSLIKQFPHCDQRVLHAPGECKYCDQHRDWQELRRAWGIAFTGYEPEGNELPDPATKARGLEHLEAWAGNRPYQGDDTPLVQLPRPEPTA